MNGTQNKRLLAAICGLTTLLTAGLPTPSQATFISAGLFDTGVDASGNSLAAGSTDTHYTLDAGAAIVVSDGSFPIPPWLDYSAANGASRWISVDRNGGNGSLGVSDHIYLTTFTLSPSQVSSGIVFSGKWSSDNASDVYVNGNLIGTDPFGSPGTYSFEHYETFSTANPTFFHVGVNVLQFTVHNGDVTQPDGVPGGWFGLRAQDLNLTAVPEPTTMVAGGLLLLPFAASTIRVIRRRTA